MVSCLYDDDDCYIVSLAELDSVSKMCEPSGELPHTTS